MTEENDAKGSKHYDLMVIGTGEAGPTIARRCRREGWSVAITDERSYGGTCGQRGCVPKKVLNGVAETVDRARRLKGDGIGGECHIEWADLIQFKRRFTGPVEARRTATLAKDGIVCLHGQARFTGRNELKVGDERVTARFIGIATGAVPLKLSIPGEELVATSDDFLAMESLPKRILFIGGGLISFEFGFIAAAAGASVTILHRSERLLKGFDPFLVGLLVESCREMGICIETDMPVSAVEQAGGHLRVLSRDRIFEADMIVHGAGRVPNTAGLDLARGGVTTDRKGIVVNPYLQSVSNPSVYVAGDANPRGRPLSPVASRDGKSVAENILHGNTVVPDYSAVPTAVFTAPVLAAVGLGEEEATMRDIPVTVYRADTRDWYTTRRLELGRSGYTVLTDSPKGRILGAHLLGYNADEMINVFALAIRRGLTLADLQEMDWAYPTAIHDINRIR
ncbi:dihydrolipoyl dehydrogenase family protein [Methanosphaerula palustris]|uniref:Pyridine nucleotide-disulphide oxidoreductase dimerisation region n=1 Tax=Methanosphaerula palustris (strain ATCC BAA-1556 / DSM 19958 / E1-9c) TaxID=521011 RepID=B8GFI6_METPE|nr:NAD(P)/FAD-dependent oxidoreductase [Methanosphaerula palustris]ACL16034.1 pyridine nucleotide-disulphide oxidoreductase dimerisation region [Methanosphaerula palustris E1-9c]